MQVQQKALLRALRKAPHNKTSPVFSNIWLSTLPSGDLQITSGNGNTLAYQTVPATDSTNFPECRVKLEPLKNFLRHLKSGKIDITITTGFNLLVSQPSQGWSSSLELQAEGAIQTPPNIPENHLGRIPSPILSKIHFALSPVTTDALGRDRLMLSHVHVIAHPEHIFAEAADGFRATRMSLPIGRWSETDLLPHDFLIGYKTPEIAHKFTDVEKTFSLSTDDKGRVSLVGNQATIITETAYRASTYPDVDVIFANCTDESIVMKFDTNGPELARALATLMSPTKSRNLVSTLLFQGGAVSIKIGNLPHRYLSSDSFITRVAAQNCYTNHQSALEVNFNPRYIKDAAAVSGDCTISLHKYTNDLLMLIRGDIETVIMSMFTGK